MIAVWTTRDRRNLPVGAMEEDHVRRALNDLERGAIRRPECNGLTNREWTLVFKAELLRRSRSK